ncbi:MAG: hypothetical protein GF355_01150 [Candidatus Eisenbacteria bacterium]|nr:hypothetical protein [Candidatus Eisenbacteria bacterium]
MIRLVLFILASLLAAGAADERALPEAAVQRLEEAEEAYREGAYRQALEIYRALDAEGLGGWALAYNAGNAAFRAGELGLAVYYYERAYRRNPRHPDIRHNYGLLRSSLGLERESPGGENRLLSWAGRVLGSFSFQDALRILLAAYWLAAVLAAATLLAPAARRWAVPGLKLAAVLILAAGLGFGFKVWQRHHRPDGVLTRTAELRAAPQPDTPPITELAAGTMVHERRRIGSWSEVEVGEEVRGWIPRASLERL